MATITSQLVKDLRERTDLPMMECKQALTESAGDMEKAIEWLRKKHKGKLAEREGRATGEGRIGVYVSPDAKTAALVELQCETPPVAKNELFVTLANNFAKKVAMGSESSPAPDVIRKDPEMDRQFTEVFGDLCMHVLFTKPLAIDRASVPQADVKRVHDAAVEVAQAEGKPAQIVDKIAQGKVNAFYAERVLLEQLHVKTDDYGKTTVGDVLKGAGVKTVTDMVIMRVGG
jgi:elongation factor Ts